MDEAEGQSTQSKGRDYGHFLGRHIFLHGEMESREQRNSVRQASRKRRRGAVSAETCSVLRAGEKAAVRRTSKRVERKRSDAEGPGRGPIRRR